MVSFWGMDATKTDRRHFFLIEDFDRDNGEISKALISAGFQNDSQNEDFFTYESGQVRFIRLPDDEDAKYFGGVITPSEVLKNKAKRYLKGLALTAKLSLLFILAYTLQWFIAFPVHFANLQWLMDILEYTIPFALLFSILTAALFVLLGLYFDTRSSLQNQGIMSNIIGPLINSFQSITHELEIKKISVKTKIIDRGVMKRLPIEFSGKIQTLGIEQIDSFYWV
jgi:hypothetical protein